MGTRRPIKCQKKRHDSAVYNCSVAQLFMSNCATIGQFGVVYISESYKLIWIPFISYNFVSKGTLGARDSS